MGRENPSARPGGGRSSGGKNLRGAVALVTGAARRLGRDVTLALARAGADVIVHHHRSASAAEDTAHEATRLGAKALVIGANAASRTEVEALARRAVAELGGIDLAVANAGRFRRTPLSTATEKDWDELFGNNLLAFSVVAAEVGKRMRAGGKGSIVAIADVAGIDPWADHIPYSVAKCCVIAHAKNLARELAPAVRVNVVAPGPILFPRGFPPAARRREIERTALKRQGRPADVSAAVLFLAANPYVTGAVLPVDGGRLIA